MTKHEPIVCCLCGKVAFYVVGSKGYCEGHRREAREAARKRQQARPTKDMYVKLGRN
jgi:hypothetical protein